jgi:hypothetical protein
MRTMMVVALAACGGSNATGVVGNTSPTFETLPGTKPFPAFERADFVVAAQTGELVAFSLTDDVVKEIGRVKHVDTMDEVFTFGEPLVFLDRDHLVVRGATETEFWIVTPAGAAPLTAPPDEKFAAIPKPVNPDWENEKGYGGYAVRRGSELYWEHCAWGYPADGFQCDAEGYIRMWPLDPAQKLVTGLAAPVSTEPTWTDAKAAFPVDVDEEGHPTCKPPKGDAIALVPVTDYGHVGGSTHWFAGGAALVEFGDYGLADFIASSFSVYPSCGADPLFSGQQYQLFHDGLWVADEATGEPGENGDLPTVSRLRRQLKVLADLPVNRGVAIRPAR